MSPKWMLRACAMATVLALLSPSPSEAQPPWELQLDPRFAARLTPISSHADLLCPDLYIYVTGGWIGNWIDKALPGEQGSWIEMGRLFPEWRSVGEQGGCNQRPDRSFVVLEGRVVDAQVSWEDWPTSHYTHDMNFHVVPDREYGHLLSTQRFFTACFGERRRRDLLVATRHQVAAVGPRPYHRLDLDPTERMQLANGLTNEIARLNTLLSRPPCTDTREVRQERIEVEWESGLAQGNRGNTCAARNRRGESCGFFSAGHTRGDIIWNWPTVGDWVHVEGLWIWDRGHPPAKTEIHPPHLVAVQRQLPAMIRRDPLEPSWTPGYLATRADIFASGDGSAFWNNRVGVGAYVEPVPMSRKDYSFVIRHILPRPRGAPLHCRFEPRPGNTFRAQAACEVFPTGTSEIPDPHARITVPWKSARQPDSAVFGQTLYLYWDDVDARGVAAGYAPVTVELTLESIVINNPQDGDGEPGEWRLFFEAGGNWFFLNEFTAPGDDILSAGLGRATKGQSFTLNRRLVFHVPPGASYRVHASGWDADGIDNIFGMLRNPYDRDRAALESWLQGNVFTTALARDGCEDDPIGEINQLFNTSAGQGTLSIVRTDASAPQAPEDELVEGRWKKFGLCGDTRPRDSYVLRYRIRKLPWAN